MTQGLAPSVCGSVPHHRLGPWRRKNGGSYVRACEGQTHLRVGGASSSPEEARKGHRLFEGKREMVWGHESVCPREQGFAAPLCGALFRP